MVCFVLSHEPGTLWPITPTQMGTHLRLFQNFRNKIVSVLSTICLRMSNRTQFRQRLATAATFLRKQLCCQNAMTRRLAPKTRYSLWHDTASTMKDLIVRPKCRHIDV